MADLTAMMQAAAGAAGGEPTDPFFENTVLLLHGDGTSGAQNNTFLDSSTNNFTITRNGNTTQGSFSPFSKPDGAFGNFFDGTGDFLTVPDNGDLDLGTGNFSVEFFWYPQSTSSAQYPLIGDSTGNWYVIWESGNISLGRRAQGNDVSTSGYTLVQNAWEHIVVTRQSTGTNDTRIFVNGVLYGVGTSSQNYAITTTLVIGATQSAGQPITGYLSNVRIIKGSVPVQYQTASTTTGTSIFTPPTIPLTAVSDTELLTCQSNRFKDNSTNNFTITRNGDVKVTPFSPFPLTTAYDTAVNGGSGYFDGTGDFLEYATGGSADFDLSSGDWTIEAWVYRNASGVNHQIVNLFNAPGANSGLSLKINSSNQVTQDNGITATTPAGTVPANTWTHIALSRSSGNTQIYVNGVAAGSAIAQAPSTAQFFRIGTTALGQDPMNGYISNFRIVKGTAVYTTGFTPPTAPLTAITNTKLLTNFTNAGIFDNTAFNNLETVADAQIDTSVKKYGTGSIEFDGTGDALAYRASDHLAFGTGNYTVECWVYFTSINDTTLQILFSSGDTGNAFFLHADGNQLSVGTPSVFVSNQATTFTTGVWYHVAACRSGTTLKLFRDGVQVGSDASDTTNWISSGVARIGMNATGTQTVFGYIDDLRITKGIARYTAAFTPPTEAFPDIGD